MAKGMKIIAWLSITITVVFLIIYQIKPLGVFYTIVITAGTVSYHFWMRLLVGGLFNKLMHNKADYNQKWFRVGKTEQKLYRFLKVKKWKKHFPTYDPSAFDKRKHSWCEIAQAMCQAELVHETIIILSFLPILASIWFGSVCVFVLTSLLSALFDAIFVVIQRYNRPRVLNLVKSECEKAAPEDFRPSH
ncbi:MAG: hypothetical protein E7447_04910 [Ruminococcaceae bacterium]|nr:hypothetical protein [Oscillospiraceae bacterium]